MAVKQPKPKPIKPIEVLRLVIGLAMFLIYNFYFNTPFNYWYMAASFAIISVLIGVLTNMEAIMEYIADHVNLSSGWALVAPFLAIILLVVDTIILGVMAVMFCLSGFDSRSILDRIHFIRFPESTKIRSSSDTVFKLVMISMFLSFFVVLGGFILWIWIISVIIMTYLGYIFNEIFGG